MSAFSQLLWLLLLIVVLLQKTRGRLTSQGTHAEMTGEVAGEGTGTPIGEDHRIRLTCLRSVALRSSSCSSSRASERLTHAWSRSRLCPSVNLKCQPLSLAVLMANFSLSCQTVRYGSSEKDAEGEQKALYTCAYVTVGVLKSLVYFNSKCSVYSVGVSQETTELAIVMDSECITLPPLLFRSCLEASFFPTDP